MRDIEEKRTMIINIAAIPAGTSTQDLSLSAALMELPENFSGDVQTHVTIEKSSWQITAAIEAHVNAACECDRCAEQYVQRIETSFRQIYTWNGTERTATEEEDVFVLDAGQKKIDLTGSVREYLLLAVPAKTLCREDCLGLCMICGTNLNERNCGCTPETGDVRWSALQNLASRNEPHS
jgi:uncharacterized protein